MIKDSSLNVFAKLDSDVYCFPPRYGHPARDSSSRLGKCMHISRPTNDDVVEHHEHRLVDR